MAVSGVSTRDPDTIGSLTQGGQDKLGAYPGGAGNPYDPEIGRVLKTAYAREVSGAVTAPVAQKSRYFWLPVIHD